MFVSKRSADGAPDGAVKKKKNAKPYLVRAKSWKT